VDTMKIQNVHDEVKYLDSLGRKKNAEVVARARIAEATAQADSIVRAAENQEREVKAQVDAQVSVARADAQRRLTEVISRRDALVAEELAQVAAAVAQAKAEVDVQKARVEQVRRRLEADVVAPAKASADAAEASAKAKTAPIIQEGLARADALRNVADVWRKAGPHAREVLLMQKMDVIVAALTNVVADTRIDKVTMIDSQTPSLGGDGSLPAKTLSTLEQIKQIFGVDVVEKLKGSSIPPQRTPEPLRAPEPGPDVA